MIEERADYSHFNRMHFRAATVISTVVVFCALSVRNDTVSAVHFHIGKSPQYRYFCIGLKLCEAGA